MGPHLLEGPFQEGAQGNGLGGEGILDDAPQALPGRQLLVAPGALDVLGVVAEAAGEVRIRIEAEQQQMLQREIGDVQSQVVAGVIRSHFHPGHGQVDAGEEFWRSIWAAMSSTLRVSPAAKRPRA